MNKQRDWMLWGSVSLLIAIGIVMFFSSSIYYSDIHFNNPYFVALKQFSIIWVGLVLWWLCSQISSVHWQKNRAILFISAIVLLILVFVPIIGLERNNSNRWINLGFLTFQPSEWAKLTLIIFLAGYIEKFKTSIKIHWQNVIKVVSIPTAILCVLLLMETDFGTTVEVMFITLVMIFVGGAHLLGFVILGIIMLVISTILIFTVEQVQRRLESFWIDPWTDPFGSGYQITQSLMSIGRGEMTGVGLGNSIHKLGYLPDAHTDFIFSIVAEELGFVGIFFILLLFVVLIWRLAVLSKSLLNAEQIYQGMFVWGVKIWLFYQLFINIAGATQIIPSKGLVLPFFSQGGSFVLIFFMTLGMLARIEGELINKNNTGDG